MDSSAASLLLLFSVNFLLLIIVISTFGILRRIRGDRDKVKTVNKFIVNPAQRSEFKEYINQGN